MRAMEDILSTYYKRTLSAIIPKLNVPPIWTFFLGLVSGTRAQNLSESFSYILYSGVRTELRSDRDEEIYVLHQFFCLNEHFAQSKQKRFQ
jgi:hypothetical protein